MKISLTALALLLFLVSPSYAKKEWGVVADSDTHIFSIKYSTLELTTNKAGDDVAAAIGRGVSKKNKTILVEKWYVRTADCDAGYGKLVTLSTDGTFKYENDFALDGGNVASSMADGLCYFYKLVKKKRDENGI